jgi:hypothetical protein
MSTVERGAQHQVGGLEVGGDEAVERDGNDSVLAMLVGVL